jgi:hypothetical protein
VEPIDIILLSHNRLEYLRQTVDALFERTPEPFRLTIVDNASGPEVRNWLASNRRRFERVIALPANEHVPAFQRGIDATTSDPYVVSDPDVEVPELRPSWLARLRSLLERHPDYGLVGVGIVGREAPPGADVVDENTGTWFQMIRRDALREPYVKDSSACNAVRAAGYRVGWTPAILAYHLGHGDAERYPGHIAAKNDLVAGWVARGEFSPYIFYHRELERIPRAPTLTELARAAPVIAEIRESGVPPASVLELAWTAPAVAAAWPEAMALQRPPATHVPLANGAAGAVAVVEPPPDLVDDALAEAFRVSGKLVVLVCDIASVGGRLPDELAAPGWAATERPGVDEIALELARLGDELPALAAAERFTTLEHRDEWIELFAAGAFGHRGTRLFVFTRTGAASIPERVQHAADLQRWRPEPRAAPTRSRPLVQRVAGRLRRTLGRLFGG